MMAGRWFPSLLCAAALLAPAARAQQPPVDNDVDRALRHATPEWEQIASHLPDPKTATPEALASAADVLRARRLQEDALDYYRFALERGGDKAKLQNDLGVTLLELGHPVEARSAFRLAVKAKPNTAQYWNNLGAAEYVGADYRQSLSDYQRAVRLDKKSAVFHSNLGTAYFELKDYESARQQFKKAVSLDPNVFHGGGGWTGVQAHVLSANDHGRFCFEMAKMAAQQHDDANMIRWLARSVEAGFNAREQMSGDSDFNPYRKDPRVAMVMRNANAMRNGQIADSGLAPKTGDPEL